MLSYVFWIINLDEFDNLTYTPHTLDESPIELTLVHFSFISIHSLIEKRRMNGLAGKFKLRAKKWQNVDASLINQNMSSMS